MMFLTVNSCWTGLYKYIMQELFFFQPHKDGAAKSVNILPGQWCDIKQHKNKE